MLFEDRGQNQLIDARQVLTAELEQLATQLAEIEPEAHLEAARQRLQDASEAGADAKALQKLATDAVAAANGTDLVGIQRTITTGRQRSLARKLETLGTDIAKAWEVAANVRVAQLQRMEAEAIKAYEKAGYDAWQAYLRLGYIGREMFPLQADLGETRPRGVDFTDTFTMPSLPSALYHLSTVKKQYRIKYGSEAEVGAVHDPIRTAVLAELGEPLPKQEVITHD